MDTRDWWQPRRLVLPLSIAMIFILALSPLTDPDLFWHLANGRLMWSTHSIPRSDPFSFTIGGKEWICHEWLTEIIMYGLHNELGPAALIVAAATVVAASFALVAIRCRTSPYVVASCILLATLASAPSLGARPQVVSLLLASLTLYIVEGGAPLWTLVPLGALWANLHGGFFTGPVIVGVYVLGRAIDALGEKDWAKGRKAVKQLVLAAVGMSLGALFNPYGIKLLLYPFQTLASGAMRELIMEWFSPDFHMPAFQPLALLLLAVVASLALSTKKPSSTRLILLLATMYAALNSARHVPLFAIVTAPVLSEQMAGIQAGRWARKRAGSTREPATSNSPTHRLLTWQAPRRFAISFALVLIAVLIVGCAWRLHTVITQNETDQAARFPVHAVDFMRSASLPGNLFNQYGWGGYLIWHGEKVFIDGRADVYGDDFLNQYASLYLGKAHPAQVFQRYDIHHVLIESDCALAVLLEDSKDWNTIYQDDLAILLVKEEAQ